MSDQFVNVPVPVDRVDEVYKLLAGPPSSQAANGNSTPETLAQPAGEDFSGIAEHTYDKREWPANDIRRAVVESNDGQRRFLRYLSENVGQPLKTQEIANALGLDRKDIAGGLSGLSRRAKSRYKHPRGWFFWAGWDGSQYSYRMAEREAAIVLEALAE